MPYKILQAAANVGNKPGQSNRLNLNSPQYINLRPVEVSLTPLFKLAGSILDACIIGNKTLVLISDNKKDRPFEMVVTVKNPWEVSLRYIKANNRTVLYQLDDGLVTIHTPVLGDKGIINQITVVDENGVRSNYIIVAKDQVVKHNQ